MIDSSKWVCGTYGCVVVNQFKSEVVVVIVDFSFSIV